MGAKDGITSIFNFGDLKSCLIERMTTYKIISKGLPYMAQDT
jgi:hypothetical protein